MKMRILSKGLLIGAFFCVAMSAQAENSPPQDNSAAVKKFEAWLKQSGISEKKSSSLTDSYSDDSPEKTHDDELREKAFDSVMQQALPLSPKQIIKMRNALDESQRAAAIMPGKNPPKPVSSTLQVQLAPGSVPPAIRLYQGFITSAVFVDSSGSPWPIESYDLGNSKAFNIQWDLKSNILMIQPQVSYTFANLAVRLKGLATPVMLTLVPGQSVVDYRVDLRIQGQGPNGGHTSEAPPPSADNPALMGVLDGVAPPGGNEWHVQGGDGQAWVVKNHMYLRTRLTLLSPGWIWAMHSPDGMNAYYLAKTPSILVSKFGKPVELKVKVIDEA